MWIFINGFLPTFLNVNFITDFFFAVTCFSLYTPHPPSFCIQALLCSRQYFVTLSSLIVYLISAKRPLSTSINIQKLSDLLKTVLRLWWGRNVHNMDDSDNDHFTYYYKFLQTFIFLDLYLFTNNKWFYGGLSSALDVVACSAWFLLHGNCKRSVVMIQCLLHAVLNLKSKSEISLAMKLNISVLLFSKTVFTLITLHFQLSSCH